MEKSKPKTYSSLFHMNMLALMTFNRPEKELKQCYKEGMFLRPNQEGFFQVSYFMMKIIYPETLVFDNCWPIVNKAYERTFRATLIGLLRGLNNDFGDMYRISPLVTGRLLSPGGDRFVKIMWEISMLAMRVQAQRESGDSEHLFIQTPLQTAPHFRAQAILNCKAQTWANVKECEAKLVELQKMEKMYKELKGGFFSRMFARYKAIRELEFNLVKLVKESDIEGLDVSEILNQSIEEKLDWIDRLEARTKKAKQSFGEMMKLWQDISSLSRDTKATLEAVYRQENANHRVILDASCMPDNALTSDFPETFGAAKKDGSVVSLLKYICGLNDKLKALNSQDLKETHHLDDYCDIWKSINGKNEILEEDLRKMELELGQKLLELILYDEKNSEAAECHDLFSVKLESVHKEISEKKELTRKEAADQKTSATSIDDIVSRFHRILAIMNQKSDE